MSGEITEKQRKARQSNARKLNPEITLEQAIEEGWFEPTDGLCVCGCGKKTELAERTLRSKKWVKDQPLRYISGHNISFTGIKHHKTCPPNCGEVKKCGACGEVKNLDQFRSQFGGHLGLRSCCIECSLLKEAARRKHDALKNGRSYEPVKGRTKEERAQRKKISRKRSHYLARFRITLEEYNLLLKHQEYKCLICKRHQDEFKYNLAIDHDHSCCPGYKTCGKCIRGLLCVNCNNALGAFGESIEILQSSIKYLENYALV